MMDGAKPLLETPADNVRRFVLKRITIRPLVVKALRL